jgi:hypothetical protein
MSTRTFALVLALVFVAIGIAGFIPQLAHPETAVSLGDNMMTAHGDEFGPGDAMLFGWFPVNLAHNLIHLLFGLWGLAASRSARGALTYARGVAILYALLAVAGLIPATQTGFGLVPLYAKSVWLHGLLALVAAYFGWVNRTTRPA